jgi:undecaprenyl-diphosphatase
LRCREFASRGDIVFGSVSPVYGIQAWDEIFFRRLNRDWAAPWLDPVARSLTGHPLFIPGLVVLGLGLLWRGGPRGLVFVVLLGTALLVANQLVANPLKLGVLRPRPFAALPDVILRIGRGNPLGSMPSSHAMNMSLIATLCSWYYRRVGRWVVVFALGVAWSRVYNGVHYPSDVLVGISLGVSVGLLTLGIAEQLWRRGVSRRWPRWAERVPSLLRPAVRWEADPVGST